MMDIVAALKWVRDNIENFGGDPGNVMIFGQSGGGGKVCHLMTMPSAKGLFHKAAIQSGSTLRSGDPDEANATAERMLAQIGFTRDRVRELQSIPWEMMMGVQMSVEGRFGPIMDGDVIPRHPFDPDAPEVSADVPLIVGTTLHDTAYRVGNVEDESALTERAKDMFGDKAGSVLRAYREVCPEERPSLLLGRMDTDSRGRRNAITLSKRKAALGRAPVFMYRFDWPSQAYGGRFGAVHGVDVPLAFHNPEAWPLTGNGLEAHTMADKMAAA
jgi:para-nitrobenzyl esterase